MSIFIAVQAQNPLTIFSIGDVLDVFMALMVLWTCEKVDGRLDPVVRSKMIMNIIIDGVIGFVPFLGDIADTFFRANVKNCILLERFLTERGKKNLEAQTAFERTTGQASRSNTVGQPPGRTTMQYSNSQVAGDRDPAPQYMSSVSERPDPSRISRGKVEAQKPHQTKTGSSSWFGRFTKSQNTSDLERGDVAVPQPSKIEG